MSEEVMENQESVETTADVVEPEESATSETGDETPEAPEEKQSKGVQKRIDELVRQREEAKRDKEYWQQMAMQQTAKPEPAPQPVNYPDLPKPRSEDFNTYDEFVEAVTDWRAEVKLRKFQEDQQSRSLSNSIQHWQETGRTKFDDFQEVFHSNLPVSQTMAEVLLDSENGVDLAYYLGKNPAEAKRIFNLPMHKQAYELGKLENKMAAPPQRTQTNAPSPTSPVGGKEIPKKSPEDMTMAEYTAWREAGGGK